MPSFDSPPAKDLPSLRNAVAVGLCSQVAVPVIVQVVCSRGSDGLNASMIFFLLFLFSL